MTFATHFCGGKIADVRLSLSGVRATCGMETDDSPSASAETLLETFCCRDEIAIYKIESDYAPAQIEGKIIPTRLAQPHFSFVSMSVNPHPVYSSFYTGFSPPGNFAVNSVKRTDICVFRI
jgi:hypothetical protein